MPETRFHTLLRKRIEEEINSLGGNVIRGGCSDHAHYRHSTGMIVGLEVALKLADEIEQEFE
jgi:hypothetical protein